MKVLSFKECMIKGVSMKIIWKGAITFGLVNIPIKLYSAIQRHALGFTLVHTACSTPLQYHRWCPKCQKDVVWNDTSKGLKTSHGYMLLTQEMIKKLRPTTTEFLTIIEFVDKDAVDIIYFDNHYYVAPLKTGNTAYTLFLKALEKLNKIAIGRFIMHDKEYTCALRPYHNGLLLTTLHYAYEIRPIEESEFSTTEKINPQELKLAQQLIDKLSVKKFDISQFKDTFVQRIKALLKVKKSTKKIAKKTTERISRKKPSLIESLQSSLKETPKSRRA